jgi:hypothetical protein
LAAGGGEAGGALVSVCVQKFAMAAAQLAQDHRRTDWKLAVIVRGGDVWGVQKQEPLVTVMSQMLRQALDVRVAILTGGGGQPFVEIAFDL